MIVKAGVVFLNQIIIAFQRQTSVLPQVRVAGVFRIKEFAIKSKTINNRRNALWKLFPLIFCVPENLRIKNFQDTDAVPS